MTWLIELFQHLIRNDHNEWGFLLVIPTTLSAAFVYCRQWWRS